jgi:hypothetical protein
MKIIKNWLDVKEFAGKLIAYRCDESAFYFVSEQPHYELTKVYKVQHYGVESIYRWQALKSNIHTVFKREEEIKEKITLGYKKLSAVLTSNLSSNINIVKEPSLENIFEQNNMLPSNELNFGIISNYPSIWCSGVGYSLQQLLLKNARPNATVITDMTINEYTCNSLEMRVARPNELYEVAVAVVSNVAEFSYEDSQSAFNLITDQFSIDYSSFF